MARYETGREAASTPFSPVPPVERSGSSATLETVNKALEVGVEYLKNKRIGETEQAIVNLDQSILEDINSRDQTIMSLEQDYVSNKRMLDNPNLTDEERSALQQTELKLRKLDQAVRNGASGWTQARRDLAVRAIVAEQINKYPMIGSDLKQLAGTMGSARGAGAVIESKIDPLKEELDQMYGQNQWGVAELTHRRAFKQTVAEHEAWKIVSERTDYSAARFVPVYKQNQSLIASQAIQENMLQIQKLIKQQAGVLKQDQKDAIINMLEQRKREHMNFVRQDIFNVQGGTNNLTDTQIDKILEEVASQYDQAKTWVNDKDLDKKLESMKKAGQIMLEARLGPRLPMLQSLGFGTNGSSMNMETLMRVLELPEDKKRELIGMTPYAPMLNVPGGLARLDTMLTDSIEIIYNHGLDVPPGYEQFAQFWVGSMLKIDPTSAYAQDSLMSIIRNKSADINARNYSEMSKLLNRKDNVTSITNRPEYQSEVLRLAEQNLIPNLIADINKKVSTGQFDVVFDYGNKSLSVTGAESTGPLDVGSSGVLNEDETLKIKEVESVIKNYGGDPSLVFNKFLDAFGKQEKSNTRKVETASGVPVQEEAIKSISMQEAVAIIKQLNVEEFKNWTPEQKADYFIDNNISAEVAASAFAFIFGPSVNDKTVADNLSRFMNKRRQERAESSE